MPSTIISLNDTSLSSLSVAETKLSSAIQPSTALIVESLTASYGLDENQKIGIITISDENLYYKRFKNEIFL
ncbi:hypothetical protein [Brochothrix thermosphacta]|uniref:hypothetical protein n=1 Tax=Brochothrix thermosphacta TaxID=2756 RepID=UPI000EA20AD8